MNLHQRNQALVETEEYLEKCETIADVKRGLAMAAEIEQRYVEYLAELIEQVAPDYIPMEAQ